MEESSSTVVEGKIKEIKFALATDQEICTSSNSGFSISHASQLSNPFLGLPLEVGKCESCGTAEPSKCEGHFGYIELPIPIYHPSHVVQLKRMLSQICLKCLKIKNRKVQTNNNGVLERALDSCCKEASQVTMNMAKTTDGACYLELKMPSGSRVREGFWDFLQRYGFSFGDYRCRPLLPSEVLEILKKISKDTVEKLSKKGHFPQEGFIMQYLPVPPNCLSVPDVSDGSGVRCSDVSMPMLKKVLRQIEIIRNSRFGMPNFDSLEVESNELQVAVANYLQARCAKVSHERNKRYGVSKEVDKSASNKGWDEKIHSLFISKGVGFSSRSVITGDSYRGVDEIGIPLEIAQKMTFEERVNEHNIKFLQKLVDEKCCLTYNDGSLTYSLGEGSKGRKILLKLGQTVNRKVMEGDIVFINRTPSTHKHSFQALSVYIHNDHTFKINPLICGPLSADFDGDCIHVFYPQSLEAKAEALELFSVEKQLLNSHTGAMNLQLGSDSLLSLKIMFRNYIFSRYEAQQLALFASDSSPEPATFTVQRLLEASLPRAFNCSKDRFLIQNSKILRLDYNQDVIKSIIDEIVTSIYFSKGPNEVLRFFKSLQTMLMESLHSEGFSLSLEDFIVPEEDLINIQTRIQEFSSLLYDLRSNYNEVTELKIERQIRTAKIPINHFISNLSSMGNLIDSRNDSSMNRIVQQIGFLGLQIMNKGHRYSRTLVEDMASKFNESYPNAAKYPSEEFGLVRSSLFHGLDPYQEMVHSISTRDELVRSKGLTEPGMLFKNIMAILRDIVVCYDGTVRNVCTNSIIQFEYGGTCDAGEAVGALAATAMSDPAYKAVLDPSPSSNSSWEMMKEILQCQVKFKNAPIDRRVMLYLNDCDCGRKYCQEHAAYVVKNHLQKLSLKDVSTEFLIEHTRKRLADGTSKFDACLVGHIHLNKVVLEQSDISMEQIIEKCQDTLNSFGKKKKIGHLFKEVALSFSECSFEQSSKINWVPCLKFFWKDITNNDLESTSRIFIDKICPSLLGTIIKGDPRVQKANIIWITPQMTAWVSNPHKNNEAGELAIDVVVEKNAVKKSGDSWSIVLDCCLPIIDIIDTRRSIPYAIKQVQDLLGISCAFEQAVQRISTSVSMVTKGVLKEHLILLASSMTYSGDLVGFNKQGVKELSRMMNSQSPFMEATLYTPKNCFERAAEKWQTDSLSSSVASCSWGKRVDVGTGCKFELLWDTREAEMNKKDGIDVYDFLQMVQSGCEEETESACLGEEIESFDMEDRNMSPGFEYKMENSKYGKSNWKNDPPSYIHQPGSSASTGKRVVEADGKGWNKRFSQPPQNRPDWSTKQSWKQPNAGEWKNKSQFPSGLIRRSNDVSAASGLITAPRQSMNTFTAEEQKILSDVDPVMQSIKRIMSGYNDGVPLSAADQLFILENVFKYHPYKAQKIGAGISCVMVDKHGDFPDSRCFHIVSIDGRVADFSYKKCVENFIRAKYPYKAQSFMAKYFKEPQIRGPKTPGWSSRGRSSGPAGSSRFHSGAKRPRGGPTVAATPPRSVWNRESKVGPHEAAVSSSVQPDGGRPRSRWYMNRHNAGSRLAPVEAQAQTPPPEWFSVGFHEARKSQ